MASRFSIEAVVSMIDKVSNPMGQASKSVVGFSNTAQKHFKAVGKVSGVTGNLIKGIIGANIIQTGFRKIGDGFKYIIDQASKIEDVTAAFTPLMGSVEKAEELVARLNKEAATTPFQFESISKTAKQLLPVMAGDINKVADTFRMLGDTAGGNAQKLDSITRGFTKAMLKGKVDMESLNMIGEAGVPIFTELASSMNTKVSPAFFKMISAGKVTTTDLTNAFRKMTSEGGIFFKGMEISSKTLSGKISTFKDNIALTAAGIGQVLLPHLKKFIDQATKAANAVLTWVTANKDLIGEYIDKFVEGLGIAIKWLLKFVQILYKFRKVILFVAAAILIWKIVTLALIGVQKIMMVAGWIKYILMIRTVIMGAIKSTQLWAIAQKILNVIMSLNPIGLIIMAIVALIAIIYVAIKNWDKFGAAMMLFLGPVGMVVSAFKTIYDRWDEIKTAFTTEGLIGGFKKLGQVLLDALLYPIQQFYQLLSKIPGIGGKFKKQAETIQKFREKSLGAKSKGAPTELTTENEKTVNNINNTNNRNMAQFSSPVSHQIANNPSKTTNGRVDINVTGQKEFTTVKQKGTMPENTKLNLGLQ